MDTKASELMTLDELANGLKIKKSWLYRKTRDQGPGSIPRVRLGKYLRFVEKDVLDWIKRNQVQ